MTQQEVSQSIAFLADKLAKYHSRIISLERQLKNHLGECKCHNKEVTVNNQEEEVCEMCSA